MDYHLAPSYRFDATNVPRKVADELLAFRTYNKLNNRHIVEFAHDILMDDRYLRLTNKVLPESLERWDPVKLGNLWKLRKERLHEALFKGRKGVGRGPVIAFDFAEPVGIKPFEPVALLPPR